MNAWSETLFPMVLDAQNQFYGSERKATVGVQEVDALIGILGFEEAFMVGAIAENGGFDIQVKASALSARPERMSKVTVEGRTLSVLDVRDANGIYTITCGDPAQ